LVLIPFAVGFALLVKPAGGAQPHCPTDAVAFNIVYFHVHLAFARWWR